MQQLGRAALIAAIAIVVGAADARADLNSEIMKFCQDHLGKTVGSGECADLAEKALEHAGGRRLPPYGRDADYVWGKMIFEHSVTTQGGLEIGDDFVVAHQSIRPGDIVQFRDARFEGRTANGTYYQTASHHTAVVVHNDGNGKIRVLEQNSNKKRYVTQGEFHVNDLKNGWVKIYRPVSR